MIKSNNITVFLFCCFVLAVTSCSSSGPATTFYSLFPSDDAAQTTFPVPDPSANISLGVGPVILPDFLDNSSIVGLTPSNAVKVYGYHAWAGDLNEAIGRVLVENISGHLQIDSVWNFPWDNRVRPDYQLRIVIENLSGIRGEDVELVLKWTLLNKTADTILASDKERLREKTNGNSVDAYVTTMNSLVNRASVSIAEKIAPKLTANSRS